MYQVTFTDNTEFTGGEPDSSMWDMLPKKQIKRIIYWLHEKEKYDLSLFEEYCHCVERCQVFNQGDVRPQEKISKVIIMGRVAQRVYQVVFDLKRGTTYKLCTPYGEEYSNQERVDDSGKFLGYSNAKPLGGWVHGILNAEYPGPKLKVIENGII